MRLTKLFSTLFLGAATLASFEASAAIGWAQVDWQDASVSFDSGLSFAGFGDIVHFSFSKANGQTMDAISSNFNENLSTTLSNGTSFAFAAGGGEQSSVALTNTIAGMATAVDWMAVNFNVSGTGWMHFEVPYSLEAVVLNGEEEASGGSMMYVFDNADLSNFYYENVNATAFNGLNDAKSGTFSFSLYNAGGQHSYMLNSYAFSSAVAPVPEPETYAMMGLGTGVLLLARRRKKRA